MNNLQIFLVDDDKMFLKSLEYRIFDLFKNVNIKTFLTGEECLDNIYDCPDAVILDYFMPGMNGLATFRSIKEQMPKMPVVLLSNNTDESIIEQFCKAGANNYILKEEGYIDQLKLAINKITANNLSENRNNKFSGNEMMFCDIGGES